MFKASDFDVDVCVRDKTYWVWLRKAGSCNLIESGRMATDEINDCIDNPCMACPYTFPEDFVPAAEALFTHMMRELKKRERLVARRRSVRD